jgi:hypothetical protein
MNSSEWSRPPHFTMVAIEPAFCFAHGDQRLTHAERARLGERAREQLGRVPAPPRARAHAVADVAALDAQLLGQPVPQVGHAHHLAGVVDQPVGGVRDEPLGNPLAALAGREPRDERVEVVVGERQREGDERLAPVGELAHQRAIRLRPAGVRPLEHRRTHRSPAFAAAASSGTRARPAGPCR